MKNEPLPPVAYTMNSLSVAWILEYTWLYGIRDEDGEGERDGM